MAAKKLIPEHLAGEKFLSKKAGSFSGVPQRNVQFWTDKKLLAPDHRATTGTGKRRLYSVLNCIEIGIISSLAKNRIHLDIIKECMEFLRTKTMIGRGFEFHKWYQREKWTGNPNPVLVVHFTDTDDPEKPLRYNIDLARAAGGAVGIVETENFDKTLIINIVRIAEKVVSKIDG